VLVRVFLDWSVLAAVFRWYDPQLRPEDEKGYDKDE
jgi:hypothetical protein